MTPGDMIRELLKRPEWTQVKLADHFGVAQPSIHRWVKGANPEGQHWDAIRELYQQVTQGNPSREVRLSGFVGAGQAIYQFDEDGAGYVEAPPDAVAETAAVEVRGDSMLPFYQDGTLLYYSKQLPPEMLVGMQCVVRLEDERVLVKILRRGAERGLWTLVSLNAPDIEDVAVQWAAPIDWIKPYNRPVAIAKPRPTNLVPPASRQENDDYIDNLGLMHVEHNDSSKSPKRRQ